MVGALEEFNNLISQHYEGLRRFLWKKTKNREQAEDLAQEAAMKAQIYFHTLNDKTKFKTWLYTIGIHLFLNSLREAKKTETIEGLNIVSDYDFEEAVAKKLVQEKLVDFARKLPFRQRTAFSRRVFLGESFKEIAAEMSCPYDTAKANFLHASKKFFSGK